MGFRLFFEVNHPHLLSLAFPLFLLFLQCLDWSLILLMLEKLLGLTCLPSYSPSHGEQYLALSQISSMPWRSVFFVQILKFLSLVKMSYGSQPSLRELLIERSLHFFLVKGLFKLIFFQSNPFVAFDQAYSKETMTLF